MNEQDDQLGLYVVREPQNACKIQSYLISLIDGTGSMRSEYESIIKAHDMKFGCFGNNQIKYQWEEQLFPFLPFRCAGTGNISSSFKTVFEQLLSTNYPKNLTFLFISDGQEPYDYNEISNLVKQIKEKYYIQFICVTVGDSFPISISNILRKEIHNQNSDCSYLYQVERRIRPESEILSDFLQIFESIRQQLNIFSGQITLEQPVFTTLGQIYPTNIVQPNEIVVSTKPQTKEDQQILQPSNNTDTQEKMINKTIVNLFTENSKNLEEIQSKCILIEQRNNDIENIMQPSEKNSQVIEIMTEVIVQIKDSNLRPNDLTEQEKTKIQVVLNKDNHQEKQQVIDKIINKQNPDTLSKIKVSSTKMKVQKKSKLDGPSGLAKSDSRVKGGVEENEAFNQLKIILNGFEQQDLKNHIPVLQNLKGLTENEISKIQQINNNQKESLVLVTRLIEQIRLIDQLLQLSNEDMKQITNKIKKFFNQKPQINEPFSDMSQDPYYLKYKDLNKSLNFENDITTVKCQLQELLMKPMQKEKEAIKEFHQILSDNLDSILGKLTRQKRERNTSINLGQLNSSIKHIIYEFKRVLPAIFKKLNIEFPQENTLYFRKTIGILFHLDTQILKYIQTLNFDEIYLTLEKCCYCKGSMKNFIECIETVACCDYDYLYRP